MKPWNTDVLVLISFNGCLPSRLNPSLHCFFRSKLPSPACGQEGGMKPVSYRKKSQEIVDTFSKHHLCQRGTCTCAFLDTQLWHWISPYDLHVPPHICFPVTPALSQEPLKIQLQVENVFSQSEMSQSTTGTVKLLSAGSSFSSQQILLCVPRSFRTYRMSPVQTLHSQAVSQQSFSVFLDAATVSQLFI